MNMENFKLILSTFFNSNIAKYIGIAAYGVLCFVFSLLFVQCSSEKSQKDVQEAVGRAEAAEATVIVLRDENERLRDTMARANNAVERALSLIIDAQEKHNDRIDSIEHDPAAVDWLTCDIPDSVREAFQDYYGYRNGDTP